MKLAINSHRVLQVEDGAPIGRRASKINLQNMVQGIGCVEFIDHTNNMYVFGNRNSRTKEYHGEQFVMIEDAEVLVDDRINGFGRVQEIRNKYRPDDVIVVFEDASFVVAPSNGVHAPKVPWSDVRSGYKTAIGEALCEFKIEPEDIHGVNYGTIKIRRDHVGMYDKREKQFRCQANALTQCELMPTATLKPGWHLRGHNHMFGKILQLIPMSHLIEKGDLWVSSNGVYRHVRLANSRVILFLQASDFGIERPSWDKVSRGGKMLEMKAAQMGSSEKLKEAIGSWKPITVWLEDKEKIKECYGCVTAGRVRTQDLQAGQLLYGEKLINKVEVTTDRRVFVTHSYLQELTHDIDVRITQGTENYRPGQYVKYQGKYVKVLRMEFELNAFERTRNASKSRFRWSLTNGGYLEGMGDEVYAACIPVCDVKIGDRIVGKGIVKTIGYDIHGIYFVCDGDRMYRPTNTYGEKKDRAIVFLQIQDLRSNYGVALSNGNWVNIAQHKEFIGGFVDPPLWDHQVKMIEALAEKRVFSIGRTPGHAIDITNLKALDWVQYHGESIQIKNVAYRPTKGLYEIETFDKGSFYASEGTKFVLGIPSKGAIVFENGDRMEVTKYTTLNAYVPTTRLRVGDVINGKKLIEIWCEKEGNALKVHYKAANGQSGRFDSRTMMLVEGITPDRLTRGDKVCILNRPTPVDHVEGIPPTVGWLQTRTPITITKDLTETLIFKSEPEKPEFLDKLITTFADLVEGVVEQQRAQELTEAAKVLDQYYNCGTISFNGQCLVVKPKNSAQEYQIPLEG